MVNSFYEKISTYGFQQLPQDFHFYPKYIKFENEIF